MISFGKEPLQEQHHTDRNGISRNGFLERRREMLQALKPSIIEAKGKGNGYYILYRKLNPKTGEPIPSPKTGKPQRNLKFTGKYNKAEAYKYLDEWVDDQFLNKQHKFTPHSVASALNEAFNSKKKSEGLLTSTCKETERSIRYFVEFIREETGEENYPVQLITLEHCKGFLCSITSNRQRNKHRANLSSLWNTLLDFSETYGILENPFARTKKVRLPDTEPEQITEHEFRLLYEGMRTDTFQMRMYKLACAFGYYTGLRLAEICFIRTKHTTGKDIQVRNYTNHVIKNKQRREVPVSPKVSEVLQLILTLKSQHESQTVRETEYLFCTEKGNHFVVNNLSAYFRENREVILPNRAKASFHSLRRSYGQNYLNNGVAIAKVSYLLGHSSIAVTEKSYANSRNIPLESMREELNRIHSQTPSLERPSYQTAETVQPETDTLIISPYGVSVGATV